MPSEYLEKKAKKIFQQGRGKIFEDGIESPFSWGLINFIEEHKRGGLEAIANLIDEFDEEVSSEALRWLGTLDICKPQILNLLEEALYSPSYMVRDGAIIGIANLDDKRAIRGLKAAINREPDQNLKNDMKSIIEQLDRE